MAYFEDTRKLADLLPAKDAKAFAKEFNYTTVHDLLWHAPRNYVAHGSAHSAGMLQEGDLVTIIGTVLGVDVKLLNRRTKKGKEMRLCDVQVHDGFNKYHAKFFNSPWVANMLRVGDRAMFTGKIHRFNREVQLQHPEFLVIPQVGQQQAAAAGASDASTQPTHGSNKHSGVDTAASGSSASKQSAPRRSQVSGGMRAFADNVQGEGDAEALAQAINSLAYIPIYPAKKGMPTWRIFAAIKTVLDKTDHIPDPLGPYAPRDLPDFDTALRGMHLAPQEGASPALTRLKYDEALTLALVMALRRKQASTTKAPTLIPVQYRIQRSLESGAKGQGSAALMSPAAAARFGHQSPSALRLIHHLPYELTQGQKDVLADIGNDLAQTHPMSRLLQGEVGSGKTVVSVAAMLQAVDSGYQCALLAPTEVLAQQHGQTITNMLAGAGLSTKVTVLTGSASVAKRKQALLDIVSGEADIVVGTHALIQEHVEFYKLGLCVVDEQHRFGVEQRDHLRSQGPDGLTPHLLVMTATPIPRTVALTAFGDLAVSSLQELPGGRKPIESFVIHGSNHSWVERMWARTKEEVAAGRQAYVVCPRIQGEGGVEEVAALLGKRELKDLRVEVLHGGMHPEDKEHCMRSFAAGDIDVIVSTTVIEVGIDVPNATVMIILEAEQFGISQLHQLRGRVGRGGNASICFLCTNQPAESPSLQRLQAVARTQDGFKLAELDLAVRQEGDVLGASQSGMTRKTRFLKLTSDRAIVERAHIDAIRMVAKNPGLAKSLVEGIDIQEQEYLNKS